MTHQSSPRRVTRSEERKETLALSMKDFAKCKSADKFRDSVAADPGEVGYSNEVLGRLLSSCFVHPSFIEVFGKKDR